MRTTIRGRIMRLCAVAVIATGLLMTLVSTIGAKKVSYGDGVKLGSNISESVASSLEGEYEYPDVPKDVYRRHENCDCTVEYISAGKRQDVWTKRTW